MIKEYKTDIGGIDIIKPRERKVSIPRTVVSIKEKGFYNYHRIVKVYIPKEVQFIGQEAFYNCSNLKEVSLANESKLTIIPKACFAECAKLEKIIIPDNIVTIEEEAFKNCQSIKVLEIPETVDYIKETAFSGWLEEQTLIIYKEYNLKETNANIYLIKEEEKRPKEKITDVSIEGQNYYKVKAKCGHVGRLKYIEVDFPIKAFNRREAAKIARATPRVKHHHKDAILSVTRITRDEYKLLWDDNPNQDYLACLNHKDQRLIDLEGRIKDEVVVEELRKNKSPKNQELDKKIVKKIIEESSI